MGIIERIKQWLKKNWLALVAAIGGAAALYHVGRNIARIARVHKPRRWLWFDDDPNSLLIKDEEGKYVKVELPKGVKNRHVTAAGIDENKQWAVEVKHETTDRRGDPARGRDSDVGL